MRHNLKAWQAAGAVVVGLIFASCIVAAAAAALHYVAPATAINTGAQMMQPTVDGRWIKAPFNINRTRECLAQSTVTLRRMHDYGGTLGPREDVVTLGLYNTTLTPIGTTPVMLWFPIPDGLTGTWQYVAKTEDDCGGMFDFAARRPRTTRGGTIELSGTP